jgi:hypothetical protein
MDESDAVQSETPSEPAGSAPPAGTANQPRPSIDIQLLADKVYALMLADLRLAIIRGGTPPDDRRGR